MSDHSEPLSAIRVAAIAMHEMYLEHVAAGFSSTEALTLIAKMAAANPPQ